MQRGVDPDWLTPDWSVPGVGALMTTRRGGASSAPFDALNLSPRVGDAAAAVALNRQTFAQAIGARPVYLRQVHGCTVLRLGHRSDDAETGAAEPEADASVTTEPGVACTVLVADCLPVLFAAPQARAVGAAHAGWRGLAGGVLEATLAELCRAAVCRSAEVQCWLGACIGPRRFEVGADVLRAFGVADAVADAVAPSPGFVPSGNAKWLADLAFLARARLRAAGIAAVHGGNHCTVEEPERFFSYRRDGQTGRMAASIWINA
jgi:polyphenol oxidase